jgi:hypothetical protein
MRTCRRVLLLSLVLLVAARLEAASHYVRSASSGSASGADWTNACTDFSGSCAVSSLVRGDTYYVGTGSYASRTFSTGQSGSALITIRGATAADHGTGTGWSNSFGVDVTQATWGSGGFTFTSSYWVFDGAVGPTWSTTPAQYGFKIGDGSGGAIQIGANLGPAITAITIAHLASKATTSDVEKLFLQGASQGGNHSSIAVSHSLLDTWQNCMMTRGQGGASSDDWLFEYNVVLNNSSTSANHGECLNPNERPMNRLVARYNWFRGNSGGAGLTGIIVANNSDNNNAVVYGNVIDSVSTGNGIITGTSQGNMNNALVYNNTFINSTTATLDWVNGPGSGNVARNNLVYNMDASVGNGWTVDYNMYRATTSTPAEAHGQTSGSGSPFMNLAGLNYHLSGATNAGVSLVAPYNVSPDGTMRGADGVWDRGALEYTGAIPTPPGIPTNLRVTVP